MKSSIIEKLQNIKEANLYRRLRTQEYVCPTQAVINGQKVTLFSGNDYLGLSTHPKVKEAAARASEKYGTSATASRLISGNHELYKRLEKRLAGFKNKEAALIYPSGYMANLGVLGTITGLNDIIYMDRLNHASLYDGCRLSGATLRRYPHADIEKLENMLKNDAVRPVSRETGQGKRFIITDGVFSMDGDLAPLLRLKELARQYDCLLMVDDAHGTGVLGENGRGACAFLDTEPDIEIGTLSKAIGSLGGFVAASQEIVDYLINKSRPFIFTTGLPPATLAAAICALEIIQEDSSRQERLLALAKKARSILQNAGFNITDGMTPIIPILVGSEEWALTLADLCFQKGIFIPAVRAPAVPENQARLRMTVSAIHTDEELDKALEVLISCNR